MPAYVKSSDHSDAFRQSARSVYEMAPKKERSRDLTIGLVNNMPDAALESTERQFLSLLDTASGDRPITVRLFSMPDICRNNSAADHLRAYYSSVEDLWGTQLDGIIVTGREPLALQLSDEPYWESFKVLVDWARERTYSAIWSCLAAHAVVLYCDGIHRIRSQVKQSGIFKCSRAVDRLVTAGLPTSYELPHSRWNGVREADLDRNGYPVLSRSEVGPDIFIKQYESLFVFFQGHPEYEDDTLMLEYRRDVGRYLKGESKVYPSMPGRYFDEKMTDFLVAFQEKAMRSPRRGLLEELYGIPVRPRTEAPWRSNAIHIYRNWLAYIADQREADLSVKSGWNNTQVIPIGVGNPLPASGYMKKDIARQERPHRIASAR